MGCGSSKPPVSLLDEALLSHLANVLQIPLEEPCIKQYVTVLRFEGWDTPHDFNSLAIEEPVESHIRPHNDDNVCFWSSDADSRRSAGVVWCLASFGWVWETESRGHKKTSDQNKPHSFNSCPLPARSVLLHADVR